MKIFILVLQYLNSFGRIDIIATVLFSTVGGEIHHPEIAPKNVQPAAIFEGPETPNIAIQSHS